MAEKKPATIFNFIDGVTHKKKEWNKWSESDQKKFSPFIVNRWLSMRMEFTEIINTLQRYTIGQLRPSETYRLYHDFLPASKGFAKYIKGKKDDKYTKELIAQVAEHYQVSKAEAIEYIDLMDLHSCDALISKYGYTDKEKKAILKGKK
jgi:hypothetical protein